MSEREYRGQVRRVVICPDSFKGSLTAREAALCMARGVAAADPRIVTRLLPIADGGEGTLDALVSPHARLRLSVMGPLGASVMAEYGVAEATAVIEMASAAGLCLLDERERSAADTTSYGVGQLVADALCRGYRKLMLTVGGSATNDGGAGMLEALGARFYDKQGKPMHRLCGRVLGEIGRIELSEVDERLWAAQITLACDVKNPLLGPTGATAVYGPQKGADAATLAHLEAGMANYARLLGELGRDVRTLPGAGAGGGLPAPLLALCDAELCSGIEAVLSAVRFEEALEGADLVLTGEGKLDRQSAYGKAISGVVRCAAGRGIPVWALVGAQGEGAEAMYAEGLDKIAAICEIAQSPEDAMRRAGELLERLTAETLAQESGR